MADTTLYLFDGYNLLHAGQFAEPLELVDALASFVAMKGAQGVLVFDGVGEDAERGPLSVRYAPHADTVLERLAAEQRDRQSVVVVSSDATVLDTAGLAVTKVSSQTFMGELQPAEHRDDRPGGLANKLDPETNARLERLRRGE